MEPLTLGLGFAISKAVFKAWFKDNEFAASASEGISDLVKGVVVDRKARNAAERSLAKIADDAADLLEEYIDFQWPGLSEYDKIDAINVTKNAIDDLKINALLMAELDFSVDRLSKLLNERLLIGALNEEAAQLAVVLASESSQMISDLASSLPEFHKDTFTEVLRRETLIIDRLNKVFNEIQAIRDSVSKDHPSIANSIFEASYRKAVARELDRIELFGLDTGIKQSSRQHSLSTAYISLSVSGGADYNPDNDDRLSLEDDSLASNKSAFSIKVEEAADYSQFVIIKGEAGSGKTTLLQSFAVQCATASYRDDMIHWNDLVPFFVRLRALTDKALPRPEELPGLVAPMIAGTMPSGWAHEQLRAGRALLLVDGLDEVSPERRDETRRWIDTMTSEFPNIRIIVTSRPTAVTDGWLNNKGFRQLELIAMSPDDVSMFIDHWHDAVSAEEHHIHKREGIKLLVPALKERVRADRSLRELAGTPLLCAMLCAMNKDRKQVLPTNRISLYEAAVYTILHGRDEERRIRNDKSVKLDLETKVGIIQEIAFWMMQNGSSMVDQWRLEDFISTIVKSYTKVPPDATPKSIISSLLLRSGIIRSPIDGKVDFIHNAFKEYFAAKAVSSGDRFGYLKTMLNNEAWREVAVLAAAMTDEIRRKNFIEEVLLYGDLNPYYKATYHLLAVRCLETCTQLVPELQEEIKIRLNRLQPPSTLTEARSLSAAGELALPLLTNKNHNARTAAACVRALRLIGTPEAMEYISSYASDNRATVGKEVVAGWPFFEKTEYAKTVMAKSVGVYGNIRIDHPTYLEDIRHLENATGLLINLRGVQIPDWSVKDIQSLTKLRRIMIYAAGVLNLNDYLVLDNVNSIILHTSEIVGLQNRITIPDLNRLTLHGSCIGVFPLESVSSRMITLTLQCPELLVTGTFHDNSNIRYLNLSNRIPNNSLECLVKLKKLFELTIGYVYDDKEVKNIGVNKTLHTIRISSRFDPYSIDGLRGQSRLSELVINRAENLEDISALSSMSSLSQLTIKGSSKLKNVSVLAELNNLRYLNIETSEGVDLRFVRDLPHLKSIRVQGGTLVSPDELQTA